MSLLVRHIFIAIISILVFFLLYFDFRRVPFLDELIYEEYKLNSDEEFLAYYRDIRKSSMLIISLSFLAFLLFCIIVILVNMKYQ